MGLTRIQKKKLGLKGRLNTEQLKTFLENYQPPREPDYLELQIKAKELGYDFKKGRKKQQLIDWIKDREKKNKRNQKLKDKRKEQKIQKLSNTINNLIDNKDFQKVLDIVFKNGITLNERQVNSLWNELINKRYII